MAVIYIQVFLPGAGTGLLNRTRPSGNPRRLYWGFETTFRNEYLSSVRNCCEMLLEKNVEEKAYKQSSHFHLVSLVYL